MLDAPFFRKRIIIDHSDILIDEEDCSVGNMRIASVHLEDSLVDSQEWHGGVGKTRHNELQKEMNEVAIMVGLWEAEGKAAIGGEGGEYTLPLGATAPKSCDLSGGYQRIGCSIGPEGLGQTGLIYPLPPTPSEHSHSDGTLETEIQRQICNIFHRAKSCIEHALSCKSYAASHDPETGEKEQGRPGVSFDVRDVTYVRLYCSNMDHFEVINTSYSSFFGKYPPSRSCVATLMPTGIFVAMEFSFLCNSYVLLQEGAGRCDDGIRQVMHVGASPLPG